MQMKSLLSLVSLLGAVLALPTTPTLKVTLSKDSNDPLSVVATVINDGFAPITILKAGILYPHPMSVVQVTTPDGDSLPFEGLRVSLDLKGGKEHLWSTIEPGMTFTNTLKLDSSFQFTATGEHTISSSAYIQAKSSATAADEELIPYSVSIKLNVTDNAKAGQSTTFKSHAKQDTEGLALKKRSPAIIDPSCTGTKYDQAHQALWDAFNLAIGGSQHAPLLEPTYYSLFKSADNSGFVAQKFSDIGSTAGTQTCTGNPSCTIRFTCDTAAVCNPGAVAISTGDVIYACDSFWTYGPTGNCADPSAGMSDILVHEISHSHEIGDIVYGLDGSRQLSADQAKFNADNYRFFARSVTNNCNW